LSQNGFETGRERQSKVLQELVEMGKKPKTRAAAPANPPGGASIMRWEELPHADLWRQAKAKMSYGSAERSQRDAVCHVLRRQLSKLKPDDHMRYVELESTRLVEEMRAIRDVYLDHLIENGCQPSLRLSWSVFRYGVRRWAGSLLSYVLGDYMEASQANPDSWRNLFGYDAPASVPGDTPNLTTWEIHQTIRSQLTEGAFAIRVQGGPFGRDYQVELAKLQPWHSVQSDNETIEATLLERRRLWDHCCPWAEGIARLFDVVQAELDYQDELYVDRGALASDSTSPLALTPIERICYKHLVQLKSGKVEVRNFGEGRWLGLLRELDLARIMPEEGLTPFGRVVLAAAGKRKLTCKTWVECFQSKTSIQVEGKMTTLRTAVNRGLHSAAKRAKYAIDKKGEKQYKSVLFEPATPDC
jgi:hypothetical protein